jgi:hypothetical protein
VTVRPRRWLALALGACLCRPSLAGEPPRLGVGPSEPLPTATSPSQQLADALAAHLRQSGHLRHYAIDVRVEGGVVELTGTVADQPQRDEAVRLVQGFPGVERVRDRLTVAAVGIQPVHAQPQPPPLPQPRQEGAAGAANVPVPLPEPQPMFGAPGPNPADVNPPRMPPYAWPTYAPYNNFSRVALPEAYPYNAWPFIGPCYPFPKIPLGWRSVKLEWDDGYWWYSRTATKYNWWKLRFW